MLDRQNPMGKNMWRLHAPDLGREGAERQTAHVMCVKTGHRGYIASLLNQRHKVRACCASKLPLQDSLHNND